MSNSSVDKLLEILDKAFIYVLNDWKLLPFSGEDPQELSNSDYDVSSWRDFRLNDEDVFPNGCWLRKTVRVPEEMLREYDEKGLNMSVSINDTAELWINGKYVTDWQWDKNIDLKDSIDKQERLTILIKGGSNHPMYLFWLANAYLIKTKDMGIRKLTDNLSLSLKTAQELLSEEVYYKNGFLKGDLINDKSDLSNELRGKMDDKLQDLAEKIDIEALQNGDFDKYIESVKYVKEELAEYDKYAKEFTMFFVANAHIDAEWLWRENEVVEVVKRTFASTLDLMDKKDDLTYTQSSAQYYRWMEENEPEIFERIIEYVKKGRWEITGGMWIEADCNLPDGQSWAKQFYYAQKYFEKKFGKRALVGYNPDSFGYNWNLPQFLNSAGIKYFVTSKLNWNDTTIFPYNIFWWEAADGSRVLTYFPDIYMNKIDKPFEFIEFMRRFEAGSGFRDALFLFGIGDHGGGPSYEMLQRIEALKDIWVFPKIEFTTLENYIRRLEEIGLSDIPTWKDELYLEFHRATFTSQAKIKKMNRDGEKLLNSVEKLSVLCGEDNKELNETAWKDVLFNQFHDILPGTSIYSVVLDAYEKYDRAKRIGEYLENSYFEKLIKKINTSSLPKGKPVILFNELSWDRESLVRVKLPDGEMGNFSIFNEKGEQIPSQIIKNSEIEREIIFKAKTPAVGYCVYGLEKQKSKIKPKFLNIQDGVMENRFFKVEFNLSSGEIIRITDKINNKEILSGAGNSLKMFGNKVPLWKAWNINYTGDEYSPKFIGSEIVEDGPFRIVYRFDYTFLKPEVIKPYPTEDYPSSFFSQYVIMYDEIDMIEFKSEIDWWEDELILKVSFPLNIKGDRAAYEIPNGHIYRSNDLSQKEHKGKFEVPALRWIDLSDDSYGVSLINNSKYGFDINHNIMRLTLLNAPLWPDQNANRGKNDISYWLYPHTGDWKQAATVRKGYENNSAVISIQTDRYEGELGLIHSFVRIEPQNIILTVIKNCEDEDNCIIIQWYETEGVEGETKIILPFVPQKVYHSNFIEDELEEIDFNGNVIIARTGKNQTVTIKIKI